MPTPTYARNDYGVCKQRELWDERNPQSTSTTSVKKTVSRARSRPSELSASCFFYRSTLTTERGPIAVSRTESCRHNDFLRGVFLFENSRWKPASSPPPPTSPGTGVVKLNVGFVPRRNVVLTDRTPFGVVSNRPRRHRTPKHRLLAKPMSCCYIETHKSVCRPDA